MNTKEMEEPTIRYDELNPERGWASILLDVESGNCPPLLQHPFAEGGDTPEEAARIVRIKAQDYIEQGWYTDLFGRQVKVLGTRPESMLGVER